MDRFKRQAVILVALFAVACGSENEPVEPQPNGEACEVDDGCESGICLTEIVGGVEPYELPDGICTVLGCIEDPYICDFQTEKCLVHRETGVSACFQYCEDHDSCRDGWACYDVGWFYPELVCLPEDE